MTGNNNTGPRNGVGQAGQAGWVGVAVRDGERVQPAEYCYHCGHCHYDPSRVRWHGLLPQYPRSLRQGLSLGLVELLATIGILSSQAHDGLTPAQFADARAELASFTNLWFSGPFPDSGADPDHVGGAR